MLFATAWVISTTLVFILGYRLGYRSGHERGSVKGFQGAIARAIEVERPLDLLRRIMVPRRDAG